MISLKSMARRPLVRKTAKGLGCVLLILIAVSWLQVFFLRFFDPPFSAYMFLSWLNTRGRSQIWLEWRSLREISPHLARAVLAAEDQRFFQHSGFDWIEMKKAVKDHTQKGRRLRGASTVTMQTARNMFLWPGRSWFRKALEAWYTVLLELFLPKDRILEVYLNTAQFGPNVYGAEAAARRYFNRAAAGLTPYQAAALAVVLPAPSRRSPVSLTPYLLKRRQKILVDMTGMPIKY
ncbi:MAG: monofunctional biosynthetic peptidoglycan transglycosylase [Thermodesulfobacteriota bacterium]